MALKPSIGRIVIFHHSGEGLVSMTAQDLPAMILEVDEDSGVCMLEVFRPRGTEWRRSSEGDGEGQWSWPQGAATRMQYVTADDVQAMIKDALDAYSQLPLPRKD